MDEYRFCVRVFLTDKCEDSIEDILHGDGSSLGPTFDQIQQEAKKYKGNFTDWDVMICDYGFPSEEKASKFIQNIRRKFSGKIDLEYMGKKDFENPKDKKVFQELPTPLPERIGAITPSQFRSLKVKIHIIETDALFTFQSEDTKDIYRMTYANLECKTRNKIISHSVLLRSASKIFKTIFETTGKSNSKLEEAKASGWTDHDIYYDSFINGVFKKDIFEDTYNGASCPEINFAFTHAVIVVCDYFGDQFIGWYFYNENLDEPMHYTNYTV